jgi:hypothetical protein
MQKALAALLCAVAMPLAATAASLELRANYAPSVTTRADPARTVDLHFGIRPSGSRARMVYEARIDSAATDGRADVTVVRGYRIDGEQAQVGLDGGLAATLEALCRFDPRHGASDASGPGADMLLDARY